MDPSAETGKALRARTLEPLFVVLESQGRSVTWLARQLGVSRSVLVNYRYGWRRVPPGLVERACKILGIPTSLVPLSAPPEVLFQGQRRQRSAEAARGPPERSPSSVSP